MCVCVGVCIILHLLCWETSKKKAHACMLQQLFHVNSLRKTTKIEWRSFECEMVALLLFYILVVGFNSCPFVAFDFISFHFFCLILFTIFIIPSPLEKIIWIHYKHIRLRTPFFSDAFKFKHISRVLFYFGQMAVFVYVCLLGERRETECDFHEWMLGKAFR